MRQAYQSKDDVLFNQFVQLKRHFGSCRHCQGAKVAHLPGGMCPIGVEIALRLAFRLDGLLQLRKDALTSCEPYVFACPDVSKHGKAYATIALPMSVLGIQDRLL